MKKSIEISYSGIKIAGSNKFKTKESSSNGETPSNGKSESKRSSPAPAAVAAETSNGAAAGKKLIFKSKASSSLLTAINALPTAAAVASNAKPVASPPKSAASPAAGHGTRLRLKRAHSATTTDEEDEETPPKHANGNGTTRSSPNGKSTAVRASPRHSPAKSPAAVSPPGKPAAKNSSAARLKLSRADDEDEDEDENNLLKLNSKLVKTRAPSVDESKKEQEAAETRPVRSARKSASPNKPSPDKKTAAVASSPVVSKASTPSPAAKPVVVLKTPRNVLDDDDDDDEEEYKSARFAKFNSASLFSKTTTAPMMPPSVSSDSGKSDEDKTAARSSLKRKIFSTRTAESTKSRTAQSFELNFDDGGGGDSEQSAESAAVLNEASKSAASTGLLRNLIQPRRSSSSSSGVAGFGGQLLNQSLLLEEDEDEDEEGADLLSRQMNDEFRRTETATVSKDDGAFKRPPVRLFADDDDDVDLDDEDEEDDASNDGEQDDVVRLADSRQAYECEELGETQAFADDLFYLMDGLRSDKFSVGQRCLSALKLAEQCLSSEFRMHLRSSHGTLAKIFGLLKDAPNDRSLALCTASVLFALSRDKLAIELDKSTLKLMVDIMSMSEDASTGAAASTSPVKPVRSIFTSRKPTAAADADLYPKTLKRCRELCERLISDSLHKKPAPTTPTSPNGARLSHETPEKTTSSGGADELLTPAHFDLNTSELSAQQLAMECLLNLTVNRRAADWLRDELRVLGAFEHVLSALRVALSRLERIREADEARRSRCRSEPASDEFYLMNKFARCLNLLESLTQTTTFGSSMPLVLAALRTPSTSGHEAPRAYANQNFLLDYGDGYVRQLLRDSLGFFFGELARLGAPGDEPTDAKLSLKRQLAAAAVKAMFMLVVNLSHANVECTKKLLEDAKLGDLVLLFIHRIARHLGDSDRFDVSVLALIVLINMFVIDWNLAKAGDEYARLVDEDALRPSKEESRAAAALLKRPPGYLLRELDWRGLVKIEGPSAGVESPTDAFEVVFGLYQTKEALLSVAETDQENELMQLNEQINSQNVENLNMTVMNSIHKAGKHMEQHIVAAHSAILLGYLLMSRHRLKEAARYGLNGLATDRAAQKLLDAFDLDRVRARMKAGSFENMVEIIKKFLNFMKIMKVSGFSADEHVEEIIDFLHSDAADASN